MYDELTEQDIKKMEEEIEYRKLVVRKNALEAVKEARAHGDLSENFEYVGVKLSTDDWEPDGIRIEETVEVAKALEKEGEIGRAHV